MYVCYMGLVLASCINCALVKGRFISLLHMFKTKANLIYLLPPPHPKSGAQWLRHSALNPPTLMYLLYH